MYSIKKIFLPYLRLIFWLTFCSLFWFLISNYPHEGFGFFKTDFFIIALPILGFLIAYFVKNINLIFWLWAAMLLLLIYLFFERYVVMTQIN